MFTEKDLGKLVQRALRAGVALSALLFLAGAVCGGSPAGDRLSRAGVLVLLATPGARVAVLLYGYARARQYLFALAAFVVLGLLAVSALA